MFDFRSSMISLQFGHRGPVSLYSVDSVDDRVRI